jgi:hypothetical protein
MLATIRSRTFFLLVCCQKNLKIRIYNTIILPVVLYGCETWSLILREEHRLRVFENRVLGLGGIFGPKRWIILGWILVRWDGVMWTGLVWLRIGTGVELL